MKLLKQWWRKYRNPTTTTTTTMAKPEYTRHEVSRDAYMVRPEYTCHVVSRDAYREYDLGSTWLSGGVVVEGFYDLLRGEYVLVVRGLSSDRD